MDVKHLAIIIDGNRRWARGRELPTFEGHQRGYENVKKIGLAALERGVEYMSVYAFSTENWKRSEEEVSYLMDLLYDALVEDLDFYQEHNVRLRVMGRRAGLSKKIQEAIKQAETETASNTRGQFNLCINYGGRAEIVDAMKQMLQEGVAPEDVTEELIEKYLWTGELPDPDFIIRTSGERRLSGFLTWASVYSELYFTPVLWPDFSEQDLDDALKDFSDRQRRHGA